jgi:hypothetical protein
MRDAPRLSKWLAVFATAALCGVAFVVAMFFNWLGSGPYEWKVLLHVGALFAVLGTMFGTVVALDSRSGMSHGNHQVARTVICSALGTSAVFVVWTWFPANFPPAWVLAGAGVGALLGWYGWSWARYVDF